MRKVPLLSLLVALLATALRAQTFSLVTGREPIASLDGLWRFRPETVPPGPAPDSTTRSGR
ncbi:MAG: hypothetical protein ACRD3N_14025 [Terracidiphilus sp.]